MPTAVKVISSLCILLASVFAANLMFIFKVKTVSQATGMPLLGFINLFSMGVLIVTALVLLLRSERFVGFVRVLIYVLMLILGLNILLMLKFLTELYAILTVLLSIFVILFLIGVRGYLNSEHAVRYFSRRE